MGSYRAFAKARTRLTGVAKPFRVRLGFHATRREAVAELEGLKARGINGWVTEEPSTP